MRRLTRALPAIIVALALAACGGGGGGAGTTASLTTASPSPPPAGGPPATTAPATPPAAAGKTYAVAEVNATGMGGAFNPAMLEIHAGDTVEWTNSSGNIHNVTFAAPSTMKSPVMYGGERWSQVFTTPGTYHYTCTFHPGMDGTIVVT